MTRTAKLYLLITSIAVLGIFGLLHLGGQLAPPTAVSDAANAARSSRVRSRNRSCQRRLPCQRDQRVVPKFRQRFEPTFPSALRYHPRLLDFWRTLHPPRATGGGRRNDGWHSSWAIALWLARAPGLWLSLRLFHPRTAPVAESDRRLPVHVRGRDGARRFPAQTPGANRHRGQSLEHRYSLSPWSGAGAFSLLVAR